LEGSLWWFSALEVHSKHVYVWFLLVLPNQKTEENVERLFFPDLVEASFSGEQIGKAIDFEFGGNFKMCLPIGKSEWLCH
jgi:hypothetical protein